jgi:hypothetical protein
MFDTDDPPASYKEFVKQIRKTVETAEIKNEEDYDTAVFFVNKFGEAGIVYAFEIFQEHNEEIDPNEILYSELPNILR